jgi:hypothetical protein
MTDRSSLTTWLLSFYTIRFNDDTICFNIPLRTAMHAFPPLDTLHSNSSKQLILPLFSFQDCPMITYVPLIDMLWATIRAAYACSCCVANIEPSSSVPHCLVRYAGDSANGVIMEIDIVAVEDYLPRYGVEDHMTSQVDKCTEYSPDTHQNSDNGCLKFVFMSCILS